jgi:hypothetical protein
MENLIMDEVLKSHFLNLYSVALSDCQVDTTELELLYKFGEERGIPKEDIEKVILHPHKVSFTIPEDILKKIEYLYDYARMIWADKKVDPFEEATLIKFCIKFGFEKKNAKGIADFLIEEAKKDTPKAEVFQIVNQNIN